MILMHVSVTLPDPKDLPEAASLPSLEALPQMGRGQDRKLRSLRAQRLLTALGVQYAPAAAAAAVTADHVGIGAAALVTVCVFGCSTALEARRYPLHLMPLGGVLARGVAPVTGFALAWLLSLTLSPIGAGELAVPLLATLLVLAATSAIIARIERAVPVPVAIVGSAALAATLADELDRAKIRRWRIVGWIDFTDDGVRANSVGPPLLGHASSLARILVDQGIELLVFGVRESERESGSWSGISSISVLERVAETCVDRDVRVIGANQFFEEAFGHVPLAAINAAWFQYVMHPRFRATPEAGKRLLDIILALAIGVVSAPLVAVAAVAIKLDDGGPLFYRQRRVGRGGREFELRKLRTMREDAEELGTPQWATARDPRLTRVGAVLRATHLDELPQLLNVLRGEMSVVGPRPERPEFVRTLEREVPFYDRRVLLKPGLTGWAQVSCGYAGSASGTVFKLSYDLFYLKRRSTILDLLIVVETLAAPLRDARAAKSNGDARLRLPHHLREVEAEAQPQARNL
jgi:exopolysaccharide biosynthesis polyprenyl glycosylphosphotransferase